MLGGQRRGASTAQVKQEGTFLNVGEPETAMLYQIKEENGKFQLFFSKKTGPKFKKTPGSPVPTRRMSTRIQAGHE